MQKDWPFSHGLERCPPCCWLHAHVESEPLRCSLFCLQVQSQSVDSSIFCQRISKARGCRAFEVMRALLLFCRLTALHKERGRLTVAFCMSLLHSAHLYQYTLLLSHAFSPDSPWLWLGWGLLVQPDLGECRQQKWHSILKRGAAR